MPEMKNKSFGAKTAVRRLNAQAAEAAYTHTDTHYPQEHTGKPKKKKKTQAIANLSLKQKDAEIKQAVLELFLSVKAPTVSGGFR